MSRPGDVAYDEPQGSSLAEKRREPDDADDAPSAEVGPQTLSVERSADTNDSWSWGDRSDSMIVERCMCVC